MASGLIYDDEGNDTTMDALSEAVETVDGPLPDLSFEAWWSRYWKNRTDTIQHTIAKGIAHDAWEAGRKARRGKR
jgi:hypothetical protein